MVTRIVTRRVGMLRDRRSEQVREPWFRNYLFVNVASGPGWSGLAEHPLIGRPISFNGAPAVVAPEVVAALREECALWDAAEANRDQEGLSFGDRVRIELGAFAGFEAEVEEARGEQVKLEVQVFGRPTPVWIRAGDCLRLAVGVGASASKLSRSLDRAEAVA